MQKDARSALPGRACPGLDPVSVSHSDAMIATAAGDATGQVQASVSGRPERGQDQHNYTVHVRQLRQKLPGSVCEDRRVTEPGYTHRPCAYALLLWLLLLLLLVLLWLYPAHRQR